MPINAIVNDTFAMAFIICWKRTRTHLNATRTSVARCGWTQRNLNFLPTGENANRVRSPAPQKPRNCFNSLAVELSLPLRASEVADAVKLLRSEVCFTSVLGKLCFTLCVSTILHDAARHHFTSAKLMLHKK